MARRHGSTGRPLRWRSGAAVSAGLLLLATTAITGAALPGASASSPAEPGRSAPAPSWIRSTAHDTSASLATLAARRGLTTASAQPPAAQAPAPVVSFEGMRQSCGIPCFAPDPAGDVSRTQYVEMVNLQMEVFSRAGKPLLGPVPIDTVWDGFPADCTGGEPTVLHDQLANRWVLTQLENFGPDPSGIGRVCVAVSSTANATGSYHRYLFTAGGYQIDFPKMGVWGDTYTLTTRDFLGSKSGVGVFALDKKRMLAGDNARAVHFTLDPNKDAGLRAKVGDGLLPADVDGAVAPAAGSLIPLVGTQDDDWTYGATRDGLNVWGLRVHWNTATASLRLVNRPATKPFDSDFPCSASDPRACLPQPGVGPAHYVDVLSYRQRPTWRLAYRLVGGQPSLVTSQSVEARPGVAGVRWYELRWADQRYQIRQQGTFSPTDGVNRWMGSLAQDKRGDIALGYNVVSTSVYPGLRYTGRLAGDPKGVMTLGERTLALGSGVQKQSTRWGDYSSMNVDPADDCTFWFVGEYYTAAGQSNGWQTRISAFRLPGCVA